MRKFLLIGTFFSITPMLVMLSLIYYLALSYHHTEQKDVLSAHTRAYAALPEDDMLFSDEVIADESRVEIVRQFLAKYSSPLEPHAQFIVDTADTYALDFRLIPAIAMQESNLCKKIPVDSHNCWGFGIYGSKITRFPDYPTAIETVTKTLATKYKPRGLVTPEEIMTMYTPGSNGSWARGVTHFMEKMR